jgi:ATP-binding protein involved in chromosome partitioning
MAREAEFEERKQKAREELLARHGPIAKALRSVKQRVAVFSGKGGVGKTCATVNLGAALHERGYQVAIFDADVHGPGVPKTLGILGRVDVVPEHGAGHHGLRFEPMSSEHGLKVISVASIWPGDEVPILWKGPHKMRAIRQFLGAVNWGHLDFLLVDLPPGTGDEVQTIMGSIPELSGMIVITTPQGLSTMVCSKAINAAREMHVPILGLVENMSGFACPHCGGEVHLFGKEKGERLAKMMEVPFWGHIPFGVEMGQSMDAGVPVVKQYPDSPLTACFRHLAGRLLDSLQVHGPSADNEEEHSSASGTCDSHHPHHHHHHH